MAKHPSVRFRQLLGILFILAPLLRLAPTASAAPLASLPPQSGLGELPWSPLLTLPLSERTNLNVNLANGNLMVHATDFAIRGTGLDLIVDRYYNSLLSAAGSVGYGWTLSLGADVSLQIGNNAITYTGPSDAQFSFTKVGSTFTSPAGVDATLIQNNDGSYTLTFHSTGVRYDFTSSGTLTAEVDKNGNTIALHYNGDGSLNTVTDTQGRATSFVYNHGYVAGMTDSTGRHITYAQSVTQNAYDLTNVSGAGGSGETYTMAYSSSNQLDDLVDQMDNETTITYDADGRVASITLGANSAAKGTYAFTYGSGSATVTDPNGNVTTYFYDSQGRLTKIVDAATNTFQWTWTADNHVSQYTDAKGQVFRYGYDPNNDLTSTTLPTGAVTSAVYGAVSNIPSFFVPVSTTDAQGNTSTYGYDGNGDLTTVTNQLPSQNTSRLYYNSNGTVDHVLDARGSTTTYGYDGVGNLIKITPPAPMQPTVIAPDSLSRVASVTDGNGHQRTYTYDQQDHVTHISYTGSPISFVYNYDASGNNTFMNGPDGATYYDYDGRNRLTEKDLPNGAGTFTFRYDAAGNLTTLTDAATIPYSPLTVTYGYNTLNLVTSLKDPSGTTSFAYDANHNRTSTTYPDGVVMAQTYDASQRLASIVGKNAGQTVLSSFAYSYAKAGADTMLPQSYSETLMGPSESVANVNGTMTYDPLNRLSKWLVTQQANPSSVVHDYVYQYDGTSNRTQIIADPQNGAGQIVADPSQGLPHSNENDLSYANPGTLNQIVAYGATGTNPSTTTYSYDTAGNQTGNNGAGNPAKALALTYLATNQTKSITNTSQEPVTMTWTGPAQNERTARSWTDQGTTYTEGYTYTPLGLAGRTSNAPTVPASSYFIRDPSGVPVAERNSDGTEYYYLFDGRGNVVALEDPGTVVGSYDYCPTGNEADLPGGTVLTRQALNNPLRQGAVPYDDSLKDYFAANGVISEDYSGVGTQTAGILNGDVLLGLAGGSTLNLAFTSAHLGPALLSEGEDCGASSNPEESTADQEGCDVSQQTSGEASASAGGGEDGGGITAFPARPGQSEVTLPPPPRTYQESVGPVEQPDPQRVDPENLPYPRGAPLPYRIGWYIVTAVRAVRSYFGGG